MVPRALQFLVIGTICMGCHDVYRKWEKDPFPTLSWKRGDVLTFRPEINDLTYACELVLGIRHIHGATIPDIPLVVKIISPSGREQVHKMTLKVFGTRGEPLASCAGDLCDLETPMTTLVFSETGQYQFLISHHASVEKIRGIMEFGVIIRKIEADPDRG